MAQTDLDAFQAMLSSPCGLAAPPLGFLGVICVAEREGGEAWRNANADLAPVRWTGRAGAGLCEWGLSPLRSAVVLQSATPVQTVESVAPTIVDRWTTRT